MTETAAKSTVYFFPKPDWLDAACGPVNCAGCGSGCETTPEETVDLDEVIQDFKSQYGERAEVKVARYDGEAAIQEAAEVLNSILKNGGEEIQLTPGNFELFMSRAAPLVAINGMFAFIGGAPTTKRDHPTSVLPTAHSGDAIWSPLLNGSETLGAKRLHASCRTPLPERHRMILVAHSEIRQT